MLADAHIWSLGYLCFYLISDFQILILFGFRLSMALECLYVLSQYSIHHG